MATTSQRPLTGDDATVLTRFVYRKVMQRIIPFVFIAYVINQIDRVNISFAKLQFMRDLGLSDLAYGMGAGLFFIGYVIFEVPSNMYLQRVGGRATFIRILLLWGTVTMVMAFVQTPTQLYVARFLLGAAEAGFTPGVVLYLTYWFPPAWRGRIMSLFFMAIAAAGTISGPLSAWILTTFHNAYGLRDWQWLFILEGIPAVLLGIWVKYRLVDKPDDARWLNDAEKAQIRMDLENEHQSKPGDDHGSALAAFLNPKVYIAGLVYFSVIAGNNGILLWVPTIIRESGITDLNTIGFLSSLPYIAGALSMFFVSRHSDKVNERRWHVAIALAVTGASYLALGPYLHHSWVGLSLLCLASAGIYSAICIFWTIPPAYLKGRSTGSGIALVSSIGMLGGFFSPIIVGWAKTATGSLQAGFWALGVIMFTGMITLLIGIPSPRKTA